MNYKQLNKAQEQLWQGWRKHRLFNAVVDREDIQSAFAESVNAVLSLEESSEANIKRVFYKSFRNRKPKGAWLLIAQIAWQIFWYWYKHRNS